MLTHSASTHRPSINGMLPMMVSDWLSSMVSACTNNTAMRTTSIRSTMSSRVDSTSSFGHGASWSIRSIAGSATPRRSVVTTPASLVGEDCRVEAIKGAGSGSVDEGCVANKGDVID
jgi:hypothetical protein